MWEAISDQLKALMKQRIASPEKQILPADCFWTYTVTLPWVSNLMAHFAASFYIHVSQFLKINTFPPYIYIYIHYSLSPIHSLSRYISHTHNLFILLLRKTQTKTGPFCQISILQIFFTTCKFFFHHLNKITGIAKVINFHKVQFYFPL